MSDQTYHAPSYEAASKLSQGTPLSIDTWYEMVFRLWVVVEENLRHAVNPADVVIQPAIRFPAVARLMREGKVSINPSNERLIDELQNCRYPEGLTKEQEEEMGCYSVPDAPNVDDFIASQNLPWHLGCAIKEICQSQHRGQTITDLKSAKVHLAEALSKELKDPNKKPATSHYYISGYMRSREAVDQTMDREEPPRKGNGGTDVPQPKKSEEAKANTPSRVHHSPEFILTGRTPTEDVFLLMGYMSTLWDRDGGEEFPSDHCGDVGNYFLGKWHGKNAKRPLYINLEYAGVVVDNLLDIVEERCSQLCTKQEKRQLMVEEMLRSFGGEEDAES